jgi:hypothetical protein
VKTVHNPLVGDVVLDCDVLTVPDSDVKVVVYSTTESGPDAEKLDFLRVEAVRAVIETLDRASPGPDVSGRHGAGPADSP